MRGDLTFLSLYRVTGGLFRKHEVPPTRDNAERLRMMRARLVPVVGNGYFNFRPQRGPEFSWQVLKALKDVGWITDLSGSTATEARHR